MYAAARNQIPNWELKYCKSAFPRQIMVFFALCYKGKLPPIFVGPHETINANYYQNNILRPTIEAVNDLYPRENWVWQQDSAPSYSSRTMQEYLRNHVPDFIRADQWPPNSCDVAIMDFAIFGPLKEKVSAHKSTNIEELRRHILIEWNRFPLYQIRRAIDS